MKSFSYFCSMYQSCVSVNEIQSHFCEMYKCYVRVKLIYDILSVHRQVFLFCSAVQIQPVMPSSAYLPVLHKSHSVCNPTCLFFIFFYQKPPTQRRSSFAPLNKTGSMLFPPPTTPLHPPTHRGAELESWKLLVLRISPATAASPNAETWGSFGALPAKGGDFRLELPIVPSPSWCCFYALPFVLYSHFLQFSSSMKRGFVCWTNVGHPPVVGRLHSFGVGLRTFFS